MAAAPTNKLTTQVDEKIATFQSMQNELQGLMSQKQKVLSQFNENTLVKGELDLLASDAAVFKLVGPVLMNIDLQAAKENVSKRLEFIEGELIKVDNAMEKKTKEQEGARDEIIELQKKMQADAATAARAIASEAAV